MTQDIFIAFSEVRIDKRLSYYIGATIKETFYNKNKHARKDSTTVTTTYSDVQQFFSDFIRDLDDAADIARHLCEYFTEMNIIRHQISVIHLAADGFTKFQKELEEFPLDGTEDDRFKHHLLLTFYRENHEKLGRLVDNLLNHFRSFFDTVATSHSAYPRLLALGNIIVDIDDNYANFKMV